METIIMLTEIKLCILWIHSPAAHNNVVQFVEIWTKKVGESLQTFLVISMYMYYNKNIKKPICKYYFKYHLAIQVIWYSYLILKKMNERLTDS